MFRISFQNKLFACELRNRISDRIQTSITFGSYTAFFSVEEDLGSCANPLIIFLNKMRAYDIQRIRNIEIAIPEYFIYFFRLQFTMSCIRYILDGIAKVFTHLWRQRNTILLLENIANSTLAALAVDTNDIRVIGTADVMRVNDDIRYRPPVFVTLFPIGHAFGNGILMAS